MYKIRGLECIWLHPSSFACWIRIAYTLLSVKQKKVQLDLSDSSLFILLIVWRYFIMQRMDKFSFVALVAMMTLISFAVEIQGEDLETAWEKYQVCPSFINLLR